MLNSKDIKNVTFSLSLNGYKRAEVEAFIDKVQQDYEQNEKAIHNLQEENDKLKKQIESFKSAQDSIQNVLLQAQSLADRMISDAKNKSADIIAQAQKNVEGFAAKEKELSSAFEEKASSRRAEVEKEIENTLLNAEKKHNAIKTATDDVIIRQQMLFDKLKNEISSFKSDIMKKYREHIEILQKIPDSVPIDPQKAASAVANAINNVKAAENEPQEAKAEAQEAEAAPQEAKAEADNENHTEKSDEKQ